MLTLSYLLIVKLEYKDKINNMISKVYLELLSSLVTDRFEQLECLSEYTMPELLDFDSIIENED